MSLNRQDLKNKIVSVAIIFSFILYAVPVNASIIVDTLPLTNHTELQQLGAQTSISGSWNTRYDIPKHVRLHDDQTAWASTDPLEKVYQFLEDHQQLSLQA